MTGLTYNGSSLTLEGTTKISHYFKLTSGQNIGDYAFKINGTDATPVQDGDFYVVTTDVIGAANLDDNYAVVVTKGSSQFTLNYSALSYCEWSSLPYRSIIAIIITDREGIVNHQKEREHCALFVISNSELIAVFVMLFNLL